jgi:hypothetical protein
MQNQRPVFQRMKSKEGLAMSTEQGISVYSPRVSSSPELEAIKTLPMSDRVRDMYDRTTNEQRFVSIEQAKIITKSYRRRKGSLGYSDGRNPSLEHYGRSRFE